MVWGVVIAVLASAVAAGIGYATTPIPNPSSFATAQATTIYYSDGKTPLARLGSSTRVDVPLSQVPKAVQHAVLAAEDRHYYSEPGISPTGIIRALVTDIRGGEISQGGSTITQQYVKNAYLTSQRTFTRKFKEIFISIKLANSRSKDEILKDYLNTIYFGRGA
jgi:membrane peptidoglycan carboxypeptidase